MRRTMLDPIAAVVLVGMFVVAFVASELVRELERAEEDAAEDADPALTVEGPLGPQLGE